MTSVATELASGISLVRHLAWTWVLTSGVLSLTVVSTGTRARLLCFIFCNDAVRYVVEITSTSVSMVLFLSCVWKLSRRLKYVAGILSGTVAYWQVCVRPKGPSYRCLIRGLCPPGLVINLSLTVWVGAIRVLFLVCRFRNLEMRPAIPKFCLPTDSVFNVIQCILVYSWNAL
jgi:hypothetical protein